MKARLILYAIAALWAGFLWPRETFGQEKAKPDHYSATWVVTGGVGAGQNVPIEIRINKYNSDEDIMNLATVLKEGGQDKLRSTLEKEDVGQLSPVGRVGVPIAVARKRVQGSKTVIRVVTARNLSFLELRSGGRSVDYPFTILELELDASGKGKGSAIGAASIRFNKKKNVYEIESLQHGASVNKLLNVQTWK